jgi:hypothetical protein
VEDLPPAQYNQHYSLDLEGGRNHYLSGNPSSRVQARGAACRLLLLEISGHRLLKLEGMRGGG